MQQVKKPARLALRQESKGSQQRNSCQSALGTHTRFRAVKRQSFIDMVFAALAAVVVPADILGGTIHRTRGFLMAGVAALAQRQRAPAEKTHAQHRQQQQQRHQLDGEREIHDKVNIAQRQRIVKEIYDGGTPLRLLAFRQAMHGRCRLTFSLGVNLNQVEANQSDSAHAIRRLLSAIVSIAVVFLYSPHAYPRRVGTSSSSFE